MDGKEKVKKKMTFEEWSSMWDRLFYICERREDFRALLVHSVENYNPKWNRGLD